MREVRARLRAQAVAVNAPLYDGEELVGVVDVVGLRELRWRGEGPSAPVVTPAVLSDNLVAAREALLEACAEHSAEVLEAVVDGREVAAEVLWRALRAGTLSGRLVPVLAGSAYHHRGVEPLLDAVVALLPSPRDRGDTDGALAALGFKVAFDDHGQLTFVRVYRGALEKGMTVLAARAGRKLRIGRLVQLMADAREEVTRLEAGEIGAIVGLPLTGGETICAPEAPVVLEAIVAPEPVVRVAVEAKTAADRERLGVALGRMVAADPSLRIESDGETGQTLLAGMGQDVREADGERIVRAELPLARSFGYAGALSGLTHGRGRFTLEPLRYEPVPSARGRAAMA